MMDSEYIPISPNIGNQFSKQLLVLAFEEKKMSQPGIRERSYSNTWALADCRIWSAWPLLGDLLLIANSRYPFQRR